jgi:hypothetical protein
MFFYMTNTNAECCCCEALDRQRYNIFGKPFVEPKEISTASVRDFCLFIRDTGIMNLC